MGEGDHVSGGRGPLRGRAATPPLVPVGTTFPPSFAGGNYGCSAMVPHDTVGKHREAYSAP